MNYKHPIFLAAAGAAGLFAQPGGAGFQERAFLQKTASSGKAEVATATLALTQASNASVKEFAQQLADDHTKANHLIEEIASKKGVPLDLNAAPAAADLSKLKGSAFDLAFVNHLIEVNERSIGDFEQMQKITMDDEVKKLVTSMLPMLRAHRDRAKSLKPE